MASSKQYEILFMLKAQIDSAFATGFNNARGYLASMQEEINRYKGVLRDISAYQKTQQSINKLNASIQQNGQATASQAQKLQDYKNRLKQIETELQNAGVDTSKLTDEQKRLEDEMEAVQQQMEEWKQFQNTITDIANAFSVMKMGADLVANAVGKMNEALGSAINSAGELQYTMSAVRGISGATEEETAALTALAKETGATTIYTASEAAQALQTEALAGWSVNQMLAGMPAVVKLAAASGEDLSSMTSIVSDSLNAFGLSGEAAVTRFADVLTKAATSSNTTVSLMGESLSHVESTAANLGYSIEDVSVLLAVMANRALKGSVSGTALNTTLTRMSGANATAAKEMDRLGISMYNADGTAKPLLEFMNELRDAFQQFGDDAQAAQVSAYRLAGQRGMRGLLSIVNASEEEWSRLTEEIYASKGAADTISDIRLDNYRGQIYLLESAMDALATSTGEALLPVETYWAELRTEATTTVNDFVIEHQNLVATLIAGAEGAGVAANAIGILATGFQGLRYAVTVLSPEILGMIKVAAGATGIAALIGAAAGSYINYMVRATEETKNFKKEIDGIGEQIANDVSLYQEMVQGYDNARTKGNELVDALARISSWSDTASGKNESLAETVRELNTLFPELKLRLDETSGALNMPIEDISRAVNQYGQEEWSDRKSGLETLRNDEAAARQAMEDAQREYDTWSEKARQEMSRSWFGATSASTGANLDNALEARNSAQSEYERIKQEREAAEAAFSEYATNYAMQNAGIDSIGLTADQIDEVRDATLSYADAWNTAYDAAGKALDGIYGLLKETTEIQETSTSALQQNLDSQLEQAQNYQQNLQTIFETANANGLDLSPILDDLISGSADAQAAAQAIAQSVSDGNTSSLEGLLNTTQEINQTVEGIKNAYAEQTPLVKAARDALLDVLNFLDVDLAGQGLQVAEGVVQGLVDGLGSEEPSAAATAQGEAMINALRDATDVHSPSGITTDIGIGLDDGLIGGINSKSGAIISAAGSAASGAVSAFRGPLTYSAFYSISYNAFQGAIDAAKRRKQELVNAYRDAASAARSGFNSTAPSGSGYATGTVSAAQGFHMVGENGPEIIWFDGGERVTNASETRELMKNIQDQSGKRAELPSVSKAISNQESRVLQVTYAPVIQMSGGNEADIEGILRRHEEDLTERLNEWMDERETAQARRGW